nr:cyclic phosphodiesterase-like [Ipomoea batatas]
MCVNITVTYSCAFQVVETSDHCCKHFGYERPSAYMPHLSLLYADITDEEKKRAQEKAYALDESIGSLRFPITRLLLYKTDTEDKSLKSWEKVDEYNLNSC